MVTTISKNADTLPNAMCTFYGVGIESDNYLSLSPCLYTYQKLQAHADGTKASF